MKLRYTLAAARELEDALEHVAEKSPSGALRVRSRIQNAINPLLDYPNSGQITGSPRLRRTVATPYPYLIFYEVRGDEVIVIAVRHAARNPFTAP